MAHALIIPIARVNNDLKYKSYSNGRCLKEPGEELLNASGVDLFNGGVLKSLNRFNSFRITKLLFDGLYPDRVTFSGNSLSAKKLYLLYDRDSGHYNVITNLKSAMAKKYICNGCDTLYDNAHKCDKVCSLCTATPPCTKDWSKYCTCNRCGSSVRSVSRII